MIPDSTLQRISGDLMAMALVEPPPSPAVLQSAMLAAGRMLRDSNGFVPLQAGAVVEVEVAVAVDVNGEWYAAGNSEDNVKQLLYSIRRRLENPRCYRLTATLRRPEPDVTRQVTAVVNEVS